MMQRTPRSPLNADLHLGLNLGHDRSAALVSGGKLLVAVEEERLDRCKHSPGLSRVDGDVEVCLPWRSILRIQARISRSMKRFHRRDSSNLVMAMPVRRST